MRRYISLPVEELISDVPVDPVHVRELADSIMVSGPICPVLAREENLALIDGFHRVAAMKELGFNQVECILSPCDEETFWDLRIMSATLHKAVTFARAIDWIDESFKASQLPKTYKNPFSLFQNVERGVAPEEAEAWVQSKVKKWGIPLGTLTHWLDSKERMSADLLEEVKEGRRPSLRPEHYIEAAHGLPGRAELQREVLAKAEREELGSTAVREVAKALRQASDEEEQKAILSRPFMRGAEDVVREVKVERLIAAPPVPEAREIIQRAEMTSNVIELKLVWEQVATMASGVDSALLNSLADNQKEELIKSGERCIQASQKVVDYLRHKLGRLIELPRKEV